MTGCAYIGIDVHGNDVCYIVLDENLSCLRAASIAGPNFREVVNDTRFMLSKVADEFGAIPCCGIDAPRMQAAHSREWYWHGSKKNKGWRRRKSNENGWGRHCEVVVKSLALANPQWTPPRGKKVKDWMKLGFELYEALQERGEVYEVFPRASFSVLDRSGVLRVELDLSIFSDHSHHMLDAFIGAVTVREYCIGKGFAVGGGDGAGQIILPRPPRDTSHPVLDWPNADGPESA